MFCVSKSKGFNLVELMIGVVVFGVLMALAYPKYQDYTTKSKLSEIGMLFSADREVVESEYYTSGKFELDESVDLTDNKVVKNKTFLGNKITYALVDDLGKELSGKEFSFSSNPVGESGQLTWSCSTNVSARLDPFKCDYSPSFTVGEVIASLEDGKVKVIRNHAGGETVTCAGMEGGSSFEYNGNSYYVPKDDNDLWDYMVVDYKLSDRFLNGKVCTTHVEEMSGLFFYGKESIAGYDLSDWDTSNVTNMQALFDRSQFDGDISGWDTSNATNMEYMFYGSQFNGDISGWDTSNVTDMGFMFSSSQFNGDISGWDTSNATNMMNMFSDSQFNGDISGWDTSKVTSMRGIFRGATSFNQDISGWDVSGVEDMNSMFAGAENFNQDLSGWCVRNIRSKPKPSWSGEKGFDEGAVSWQENYKPVWGTCP